MEATMNTPHDEEQWQCRCLVCKRKRREANEAVARHMRELEQTREAAGECRHCGGAVPCWSPFGDVKVGKKHA
jgi:hypothetical protein